MMHVHLSFTHHRNAWRLNSNAHKQNHTKNNNALEITTRIKIHTVNPDVPKPTSFNILLFVHVLKQIHALSCMLSAMAKEITIEMVHCYLVILYAISKHMQILNIPRDSRIQQGTYSYLLQDSLN